MPGDQTSFQNVPLDLGGLRVGDADDANLTLVLQVGHGTLTVGRDDGSSPLEPAKLGGRPGTVGRALAGGGIGIPPRRAGGGTAVRWRM